MAGNGGTYSLDAVDRKIVDALMRDARITWVQLAAEIGLSGPSTTERVRKLERNGIITGYRAEIDPDALGLGLLAFVAVSVENPGRQRQLLRWAQETPQVQECHVVAGAADFLMKIRCRDASELELVLNEGVRAVPGVTRTQSTIVLRTAKETATVPLDPPAPLAWREARHA